ncbi:MAG: hypothetical protein V1738_04415 [Patescibacteria group bacterium]
MDENRRKPNAWTRLRNIVVMLSDRIQPTILLKRFQPSKLPDSLLNEQPVWLQPKKINFGSARIIVPGHESITGRGLIDFARDLAELLGMPCEVVWGASDCDLRSFDFRTGDILVAKKTVRRDVNTLVPFDEVGLLARGQKPKVLIPLSNDESGYFATAECLPIIAALGYGIMFWHTTWRNAKITSAVARDHLSVEAKVTLPQVERLAETAGVPYETHIELAECIEYGLVEAALDKGCCLIVMARGRNTVRGSYVDGVLSKSSVPVLVMGRPIDRSTMPTGTQPTTEEKA